LSEAHTCPCVGRRFPELVSGKWKEIVSSLADASFLEVMKPLAGMRERAQSDILRDWGKARDKVIGVFALKFQYTEHLPYSIGGIAVRNQVEARHNACKCLHQWNNYKADNPDFHQHHGLVKLFFQDRNLHKELEAFVDGARLSDLQRLQQELALLRLIPLNETAIEAKHALQKANLRTSAHPTEASVSLSMRLPELRKQLACDSDTVLRLAEKVHIIRDRAWGPMANIVREIGLSANEELITTMSWTSPKNGKQRPLFSPRCRCMSI
jgi:hypothetical protein